MALVQFKVGQSTFALDLTGYVNIREEAKKTAVAFERAKEKHAALKAKTPEEFWENAPIAVQRKRRLEIKAAFEEEMFQLERLIKLCGL